ncbi:MAG TPA: response regulator transcription factor [Frankiaceae bacterium]|nr:response regulator transcription factor [Frankiaceae bacterium]
MTLRLYVVDDHPAVLAALTGALARRSDVRVAGTATCAETAYDELAGPALQVDVALVDVRLPGASGIELCRRLAVARPDIRCVLLSAADDPARARAAFAAGAAAYLVKDLSMDALAAALHTAVRGERFADRRLGPGVPPGPGVAALSPAERHVLRLVADGLTNAEIAAVTHAPSRDVGARVARVLVTIGARTRADAARIALREASR